MSAAPGERFEVRDPGDLDAAGVLGEADLVERRVAVRKLELAYQWAVLHPAPTETQTVPGCRGCWGPGS